MDRAHFETGPDGDAEWPRITEAEIARAARALVDAYGADAIKLMQNRTRAVRRRGDTESATLWFAIAKAVEEHLAGRERAGATGD